MRYLVPGDVVLAMAVATQRSFEALRLAALASAEGDAAAVVVTLKVLHQQLGLVYEALAAVVTEQEETVNGSPRPS